MVHFGETPGRDRPGYNVGLWQHRNLYEAGGIQGFKTSCYIAPLERQGT